MKNPIKTASPRPWRRSHPGIIDATYKLVLWDGFGKKGISRKVTDEEQDANAELVIAAVNVLDQIHSLMWDDEEGDWREIQSGADFIQDVTAILTTYTPATLRSIVNALPKCDWCQERFDPNKSTARTDAKHFCSTSCENDFRREGLAAAAAAAADRRNR